MKKGLGRGLDSLFGSFEENLEPKQEKEEKNNTENKEENI